MRVRALIALVRDDDDNLYTHDEEFDLSDERAELLLHHGAVERVNVADGEHILSRPEVKRRGPGRPRKTEV